MMIAKSKMYKMVVTGNRHQTQHTHTQKRTGKKRVKKKTGVRIETDGKRRRKRIIKERND